jgi:hypothetical protein
MGSIHNFIFIKKSIVDNCEKVRSNPHFSVDFIGKIGYNSYIIYWENEPILSRPLSYPIVSCFCDKKNSLNPYQGSFNTEVQFSLYENDTLAFHLPFR